MAMIASLPMSKTNMSRVNGAALVGLGLILGCGAGASVPVIFAQPSTGSWACYDSSDFEEPDFGASGAKKYTAGMNQVAGHAPAGTTLEISRGTDGSLVCVKH